jgi:hypothetical protein
LSSGVPQASGRAPLEATDAHSTRDTTQLGRLIAACSAALLFPLLVPLLTGRVFVFDDLSGLHLPMRYLYQQALQAGDTLLWTPSIFAGFYLHGEGQIGLFHPFHQLLYRFLPLGMAFNLELIASYPAAFAGMFWFLRRLRFSRAAALFGAMLFAFSGFNLLHHHHINLVAVVAHMPWLLTTADMLILGERERQRALAFAAMAMILGSEFLLGFPQAVLWNLMALTTFGVFRAGETRRWRRLLPCAAAVAVGILLGGIQLVPTADAAEASVRKGLSGEFPLSYSLHPLNLLQLWSPYAFERGVYSDEVMSLHEFGIYSGAILPVALIWVWIRRRALSERRALIVAVTMFAAVCLLLALGRYGGVVLALTHLPVLQSLRAPARYIVLVQFALAILAAVTIDDLLAIAGGRSSAPSGLMAALWIPAVLGLASTAALNARLLHDGTHTFASPPAAAAGVAIVSAVTLLTYLAGRRVRWAVGALVVVTAADLGAWGILFIYREPALTIRQLTRPVTLAPGGSPAESYASGAAEGLYRSDFLVMRGYRLTSGYVSLSPATRHPLDSDVALRLSGTRWFFTPDGSRHAASGWAERVRLLDRQGEASTGSARLTVDRPGYLVAQVEAPDKRILAFTERFHDGWSASIDGIRMRMVRVEGDFLGCVVDGGVHTVTLRFRPRSFLYGAMLSAIGAALLAGVLIAGGSLRR